MRRAETGARETAFHSQSRRERRLSSRRRRTALAAVAGLTIVVVVAAVVALNLRATSGAASVSNGATVALASGGSRPARVPSVVGMTLKQAEAALHKAALATPTIEVRYDNGVPARTTLSQQPAPGTAVMSGSTVALVVSRGPAGAPTDTVRMEVVKTFGAAAYSPKSVVATQRGLVFAQNMMYRHTISVFDDTTYGLVKTILDRVTLPKFGYPQYPGSIQGAPVESAVTPDGAHMYVSQYSMYGPGFSHPGDDDLGPGSSVDPSFVYRVSTKTLKIDQVIKVGSVPKYVAVTPAASPWTRPPRRRTSPSWGAVTSRRYACPTSASVGSEVSAVPRVTS